MVRNESDVNTMKSQLKLFFKFLTWPPCGSGVNKGRHDCYGLSCKWNLPKSMFTWTKSTTYFVFFSPVRKKKFLFREVFILLIHCKLKKNNKNKEWAFKKELQSEGGWGESRVYRADLRSHLSCPCFILLARKYQSVWKEERADIIPLSPGSLPL